MSNSIFKVNQNIEVVIKHGLYMGNYNSRIEDVTADTIEIAIPSKQGHLLPLPEQTWFHGKIVDAICLYIFKAKILKVELKKGVPTWVVEMPKEIEKTQRRCYIRIDIRLPLSLKIVPGNQKEWQIDGKNYSPKELENHVWEMTTKDISGSGAKIISKYSIPAGTNVFITVSLQEHGEFTTLAEIVRCELVNPELGLFWIGVQYIGLSERERDKVVRYVFKKQIELRKRNLL